MSEPMSTEREGLAELLSEHEDVASDHAMNGYECSCGWGAASGEPPWRRWTRAEFYAHVAGVLAARDRRVRAEAMRPLRAGIWALGESIYGEEGVEHNEGCMGEPDCLACIVSSLRRLLATTEDDA